MNARRAAAAAAFVLMSGSAAAAPADFYPFAQRWAKARSESVGKDEAVEGAFTRAAGTAPATSDPLGLPPPSIKRALSGIASSGQSLEIEDGQTLILASDTPLAKFASTDEDVVELETADPSTLVIVGSRIGKTVVHVWNGAGRTTFEVRVIPRKITGPTYMDLKRDELQKTRPFKVRFTADGDTYDSGRSFREMNRTSLDTAEAVVVEGDTPYGYLHSHTQIQRSGRSTKNVLTDAQVALSDGRIGPLQRFNAAAGDSLVRPDFLVFSRGRIRGVAGDAWSEDKRFDLSGFFGREQQGIFAPLSPTSTSTKRTIDSFLSGTVADYRPSDDLKMRAGYFTGYGRSRPDELNRQGIALSSEARIDPHVTLLPEIDTDSEHVAHLHAVEIKGENGGLRSEFRNVNENFESMIGAPSEQGELGGRWDAWVRPWEHWRWRGTLDVFKDRRIPNPERPGERNIHADAEVDYEVGDSASLAFTWRDWDDTGRLSPSRERALGVQYTESFDAFGRPVAVNVRAGRRESRFLTQSTSNYDRYDVAAGVFVRLFWDIRFSLQKEWNWLDDLELPGGWSQPQALTYGLNYSHRLWQTPFYLDVDFRYRDEEETESPNSFMIGEDVAEINAALYYRETEDLELYLKGGLQNYNPESLLLAENRVEAQILAGMRWDWDTGIRWSGVGTVKGSVFKDENQNGVRDPGEPGLPGQAIEALGGQRGISDADGYYEIRDIADRATTVSVESAKIPAGYVPTSTVLRETPVVPGGTVVLDFGFAPRSEVSVLVFNDLNGNGRHEPSEPGVGRVRLKLDGKSASSAGNGIVAFQGVEPGAHEIALDLGSIAEGYLPSDVTSKRFELSEGMRFEWSVPLQAYRVVSGTVFRDRDGNGAFSVPEDQPLAGIEVSLGAFRQKTDESGRFLFDNLPAGTFQWQADVPLAGAEEKLHLPPAVEMGPEPRTISNADIGAGPKAPVAPQYSPKGTPPAKPAAEPEAKEPSV